MAWQTDTMWLLLASDENYAMTLAVTLTSALMHLPAGTAPCVVVVADAWSSDSRRRLEAVVAKQSSDTLLHWRDAATVDLSRFQGHRHIKRAAYLRLFAEHFMPADADRVLYLDADLLINANLTTLYGSDLHGHLMAAARDQAVATLADSPGTQAYATLGLQGSTPYFNTGVLLMNLHNWRRSERRELLMQHAALYGHLGFCDQDALNLTYSDQWLELSPDWNVQGGLLAIEDQPAGSWPRTLGPDRARLLSEGKIFHFSGPLKPWTLGNRHPQVKAWHDTLARSGWFTSTELARHRLGFCVRNHAYRVLTRTGVRALRGNVHPRIDSDSHLAPG